MLVLGHLLGMTDEYQVNLMVSVQPFCLITVNTPYWKFHFGSFRISLDGFSQGSCAVKRITVRCDNRKGFSAYKSLKGMEEGRVPRVTFRNDTQNHTTQPGFQTTAASATGMRLRSRAATLELLTQGYAASLPTKVSGGLVAFLPSSLFLFFKL